MSRYGWRRALDSWALQNARQWKEVASVSGLFQFQRGPKLRALGIDALRVVSLLNRCPDQQRRQGAGHRNSLPELLGSQPGSKAVSAFR
jgi:hypothetical protein